MDKYCERCYLRDAKPCMECSTCNPGHRNFRPAPTPPPTNADRTHSRTRLSYKDEHGQWAVDDWKRGITVHGIAVERLAAYEDTEMEPQNVLELQRQNDALAMLLCQVSCNCKVTYTRLRELAEADLKAHHE